MGLMRRVGPRTEDGSSAGAGRTAPRGSGRAHSDKGSKLQVQPAELARKLVKEMEDHKVSRSNGVLACNQFTVFVCPEDHKRLAAREHELLIGLERHLAKHARSKKYDTPGDIVVEMAMDPELAPGYFGILAERIARVPVEPMEAATSRAATSAMAKATSATAKAGPAAAATPKATRRSVPSRQDVDGGTRAGGATRVIRPEEAAELDLAHKTIVLKAGNRVREFSHGRVVVGRGRDADFRVEDPNVSRRHLAVYWAEGDIMVEDLDSTNGTLVNGRAVTNAVVRPGDVLAIGECRITVETR